MKKIFCLFIILGIMFIPRINVHASDLKNKIEEECRFDDHVTEIAVNDEIMRKEILSYRETNDDRFNEGVSDENYRYITARLDVIYEKKTGEKISSMYMEANFRYNTKYKEAKCLSTSHGEELLNDSYKIKGFARTQNAMWTNGGAYGKASLKSGVKHIDKNRYMFTCDSDAKLNLIRL